jgi:hypothetical protein
LRGLSFKKANLGALPESTMRDVVVCSKIQTGENSVKSACG